MVKSPKVHEYIAAQFEVCGKSQKQVAEEVEFNHTNVLSMTKHGTTKVPIPRVNALADALEVNRAHLMRKVLNEYMPEALKAIEAALGEIKEEQ